MNLEKERELFKQAYFNLRSGNSLPSTGAVFDEYIRLRDSEGYKLVPVEPSEDQWGGLARHLVKYMQSHDRYCPKTLGKYISRYIGLKNIPDWLNKEVPNWESDHAFATADLGVFIYKAMIGAAP